MTDDTKCNKCQKVRNSSNEHIEFLQKFKNCPECRSKIAQMKKQQRKNKSEKAQTTHKDFNDYLDKIDQLQRTEHCIKNLKFYSKISDAPLITNEDLEINQVDKLALAKTFLKENIISKIEDITDTSFAIRSSNFKNNKKLYISLICCQDQNGLAKSKSKGLRGFNNKKRIYDCKSLLILNYSPIKTDLTIEFTHEKHTKEVIDEKELLDKKLELEEYSPPVKDQVKEENPEGIVASAGSALEQLQANDQAMLLASSEYQHSLQVQLHHQRQLQIQQLQHQRQQQQDQFRLYQHEQRRLQHAQQQVQQVQLRQQAQFEEAIQNGYPDQPSQHINNNHPIIDQQINPILQDHQQRNEINDRHKTFEEANNALMAHIQNATEMPSLDDHLTMSNEITSDQIDNALLNSGIATDH